MEKRTPHYHLSIVKSMVQAGKVRMTVSAYASGAALGFSRGGIVDVVMSLTLNDFYKSMTTHTDYKVWQDVYCPTTKAGGVYLKLTVINEVLIVSFKEL
jgi:motility quorum-sensing regulator/GCU-specific mRNA interferase toxin